MQGHSIAWPVVLKMVKVKKNKERLRKSHWLEENGRKWQMQYHPGLDSGTEGENTGKIRVKSGV